MAEAAGLLALVFLALASADTTFIERTGLGTARAVLVERLSCVASSWLAFIRLAARHWWTATPLRRLQDRFGLRETPSDEPTGDREPVLF